MELANKEKKPTIDDKLQGLRRMPSFSGFRIRSDIRAGDWRCSDCTGKTMGSSLFKPSCEYCEKV